MFPKRLINQVCVIVILSCVYTSFYFFIALHISHSSHDKVTRRLKLQPLGPQPIYYNNSNFLSGKRFVANDLGYIINQRDICRTRDVFLLTIVTSQNKNIAERTAIRRTWGNTTLENDKGVATVFLLAKSHDQELMNEIQQEANAFRDILLFDFTDDYLNLTLKTIHAFRWAVDYCPRVSYILKTDDDVFVNYDSLMRVLISKPRTKLALGQVSQNSTVIRSPMSKWNTQFDSYPDPVYPPYLVGTGYVLSRDVVEKVRDIAPSLIYLNWEDVFVGICLRKIGVDVVNDTRFGHDWSIYSDPDRCKLRWLFTSHHKAPSHQLFAWKMLQYAQQPKRILLYPCVESGYRKTGRML
ncbi:beta-1,3-galactosyltransferase 5-like [Saccoglossus kowalevskii]|uniref:Hexosyltransferase n=1 Tax=Saccoglossus kowalevskii TaxID=10224 RepID=A0ABM0MNI4_SACKO|nr:PREDICTED: beta-1,3-galactosyltransferase 1-like [Saccoglossus kowalevskii]